MAQHWILSLLSSYKIESIALNKICLVPIPRWKRYWVRRFDTDFTSDEVTSENHCRIASRVTKKSLFTVTNVLFYFLHAILCHEHTNPLRTIIEGSFRHSCQGRPFLTEHCDVTTIDLWRHANAKYWYCDVIFVNCHCTRKLAQRRSSLVNNSREYRYLTTRYSRLSV